VVNWFSKLFGRKIAGGQHAHRVLRARYDAATTTDDNRRHWSNADGLSANAANSPDVRRVLRNRARYEVANNSYARGIVLTLANDVIGTGPRLQMLTADSEANRLIEQAFAEWAQSIRLAEKLRTMRMARAEDGEAFAILTSNPRLDSPVRLDLKLVEADQVTTPGLGTTQDTAIDGIVFDTFGNPVEYHVLKTHPGDPLAGWDLDFDRVPAASMIHWFRADRPGQARGVPDITPALPLFAQLRRFTLAVLGAAETAADFAGILYTDAPASGEADAAEPFEPIELEQRALLTMPGGWKMSQLHAEQPATTFADFKREILNEIARCLNMPYNVAAGNSSGYNYASGRLDHQTYFKSIRVEQSHLASVVLDRLFDAWLDEAVLIEGFLPEPLRYVGADLSHQWLFDGHEHVDPAKEANAQATRLANHTTTLANEYARQGRDWNPNSGNGPKKWLSWRSLGSHPPTHFPSTTLLYRKRTIRMKTNLQTPPENQEFNLIATQLELEAAATDGETTSPRRFMMTAYTGGPMKLAGWRHPVVVDLAGLAIGDQNRPILLDHARDVESVMGQTDEIAATDGQLLVTGQILGDSLNARQVIALADKGFAWRASIGARAEEVEFVPDGAKVQANGQTFTGPLHIARKATLGEISFVVLAADDNARAQIAATVGDTSDPSDDRFSQWVEAQGFDMNELNAIQIDNLNRLFNNTNQEARTESVSATADREIEARRQSQKAVADLRAKLAAETQRVGAIQRICDGRHPQIEASAIADGWDEPRTELEVLRAERPSGPAVHTQEDNGLFAEGIEAALCMSAGNIHEDQAKGMFGEKAMEAALGKQLRGIGLHYLMHRVIRAAGKSVKAGLVDNDFIRAAMSADRSIRASGGFSTISLTGILSNVANKTMLASFEGVDNVLGRITAQADANDF